MLTLEIRILTNVKNREFGIKRKRISFGEKINKIKCRKIKKVKRLIKSGRSNQSFSFLR